MKLRALTIALAAAIIATAVWFLWPSDHGNDATSERDLVARTAARQVAALNSMDPGQVDVSLSRWLEASTGTLHDQLQRDRPFARAKFVKAGTTASGTVTGLAVTDMDMHAGRATVLVAVRVKVTSGAALDGSEQRKRYQVGMIRTQAGDWRVTSLIAVPAGAPAKQPSDPAIGAVSAALTKVLSYSYADPAATQRAAETVLTGRAASDYRGLFGEVVRLAPQQKLTLTTNVVRAGLVKGTGDTAVVLVFLDQKATRSGLPQGKTATAQLVVTARHDRAWRISELTVA